MSVSIYTKFHSRGFTLIELMIALVIAGVLALIAYNTYTSYVVRAQRSTARSKMMEVAQHMERYYSANNHYPSSSTTFITKNKIWIISYNPPQTHHFYTLVAKKQKGLTDKKCGSMTYKSNGIKKPKNCWPSH